VATVNYKLEARLSVWVYISTYGRLLRGYKHLQYFEINFEGVGVLISCQDVNFHKSLDMICVWQVFGDVQDFTSIAEIFISDPGGITTICGSRISNTKVWIKVCSPQSHSLNGAQKKEEPISSVGSLENE